MTARRCGHRSLGGVQIGKGFGLRCKTCGLETTTERPDLESAFIHRRDDLRDAEAEKAARAQRKKRDPLIDAYEARA